MKRSALSRRTRGSVVPLTSSLVGTLTGGALGAVLVGCSVMSPAVIATPYAAADGVNATLPNAADGSTVDLRNMLLIAPDQGGRGRLLGTLVNTSESPVQVTLSLQAGSGATSAAPTRVAVPAGGVVQLGTGGPADIVLAGVPGAGRLAAVTAQTSAGGTINLTMPVLAPEGFYATLAPPPAAATATP